MRFAGDQKTALTGESLYLSIFQKHGATSSDMSKNEEEMLLPSEENIIMEEEFYPSATYARGQRNTTAGKSDCRVSSSEMFLCTVAERLRAALN